MENFYCNRCKKFSTVFEHLDSWNIYEVPYTIRGYESTDIERCPNCDCLINPGSYIIIDEAGFVKTIGVEIARVLSNEVAECEYCSDSIILYTQKYGDPLDLNTVSELVEGYDLPDDIEEIVYQNLYCSTCNSLLDCDAPYVTPYEAESWYRNDVGVIVNTFGITIEDGQDFIKYLLKNPMLGLNHPIGQKIFNCIKGKNIEGIIKVKSGEKLFRGRKRYNLKRLAPYIQEELWNPPEGVPGQGRYNPPGVSSLYLANNTDVILDELNLDSNEESIDIAEFLILKDMLMWDTRESDINIFSSIPSLNNRFILKGEYIFPNFIAQCLMVNNYNGIIYESTRGEGLNYCLFNFKRERDIIINKIIPYNELQNLIQINEITYSQPVDDVVDIDDADDELPF